jgi:hypothetical protein
MLASHIFFETIVLFILVKKLENRLARHETSQVLTDLARDVFP